MYAFPDKAADLAPDEHGLAYLNRACFRAGGPLTGHRHCANLRPLCSPLKPSLVASSLIILNPMIAPRRNHRSRRVDVCHSELRAFLR